MVSLNTIITLGGLGAAYLIFTRLGGGAGIGSAIGSQIGDFTGSLGAGLTQAVNKFGNLVETPQANASDGYRLDPTETRNYEDYVNYNDPTPTPTDNPPFLFPDPPAKITPPPVIQYGDPLPPFAGDLEYVVKTNDANGKWNFFEQTPIDQRFPNVRKATAEEKTFLQRFGIGL